MVATVRVGGSMGGLSAVSPREHDASRPSNVPGEDVRASDRLKRCGKLSLTGLLEFYVNN
jgi:hypothetical protein